MPQFLEAKLKKQYGANSKIPYKIMNSIGAMRGNKITGKGQRMQSMHMVRLAKLGNASSY